MYKLYVVILSSPHVLSARSTYTYNKTVGRQDTYEGQYVSDVEGWGIVKARSVLSPEQGQLCGQLIHHRIHGREEVLCDQHKKYTLDRLYADLGLLHCTQVTQADHDRYCL